MNTIALGILAFTVASVLFGFFLGLIRGCNRSILRLVLIIACAVGAFIIKDMLTEAMMGIQIDGQTIPQILQEAFADGGQELPTQFLDIITVIAKLLVGLIAYFVVFFALQGITWLILFPILKIFVRKGANKRTLIGGAIGLVQGVLVAFLICAPLTGILFQVGDIMETVQMLSAEPAAQEATVDVDIYSTDNVVSGYAVVYEGEEDESENPVAGIGQQFIELVIEFKQSPVAQAYNTTGSWYFDMVATTTNSEGEQVKLSTTVKVMSTTVTMIADKENGFQAILDEFEKLAQDNLSDEKMAEIFISIGAKFEKLDQNMNKLGEEGKKFFDQMLNGVKELIYQAEDGEVDQQLRDILDSFTVDTIDFGGIGEIFSFFGEYALKDENFVPQQSDYDRVVNVFARNGWILDVIGNDNGNVEVGTITDETERNYLINAINNNTNPEFTTARKNILRAMFGLSSES